MFSRLIISIFLLSQGACFFVQRINEAPVPVIEKVAVGPHYIGDEILFSASKSRDDVDSFVLSASWTVFVCDKEGLNCAEDDKWRRVVPVSDDFAFVPSAQVIYKIQLQLEDTDGARAKAPAIYTLEIANQLPRIAMQAQGYESAAGTFVFSLPIDVFAEVTDAEDGDGLSIEWELETPSSSNAENRSFEILGDSSVRLTPDVFGVWVVTAKATDSYGDLESQSLQIVVDDDRWPCLASVLPLAGEVAPVRRADGPKRFAVVQVLDDLDPFPISDDDPNTGVSGFAWTLSDGSGNALRSSTQSDFWLNPDDFPIGTELRLAVDISDRTHQPQCDESETSCQSDATCDQRQTWFLEVQ